MRADQIPAYEQEFDRNGVDSEGKYHILTSHQVQIPDGSGFMNYVRVKPASGDESYYYREEVNKDQIVLHYTMGYLKGDIATLTQPNYHVSVPFVIGRNGKIYNLFFSGFWSYHLGRNSIGGNTERSRATIGIELSNIGHLKRQASQMISEGNNIYCDVSQIQYYQALDFQDFHFFATFTDAQYESLIILLRYLTARYEIPAEFLADDFRYRAFNEVVDFRGIVSHVNYRGNEKEDIGPAFDWNRVINALS